MSIDVPTDLDGCLALLPDNDAGEISAESMRAIVTCLYNAIEQTENTLGACLSAIDSLNVNYQLLDQHVTALDARVTALEAGP